MILRGKLGEFIKRAFGKKLKAEQPSPKPSLPPTEGTVVRLRVQDIAADSLGHGGEMEKTKTWTSIRPSEQERWIFTVTAGMDRGRQYVGNTGEIKIGRRPENHIQLKDPKVSRFHAVIKWRGKRPVLKDLRSMNGTRLNGREVAEEHPLSPGDVVLVGETEIRVAVEKAGTH